MEAGTFPDEKLKQYIKSHFIPGKFRSGIDADQFNRFGVTAEPAFIVLDAEGNEVYRKIGFFEADLLIDQLAKARKKAAHRAGTRIE